MINKFPYTTLASLNNLVAVISDAKDPIKLANEINFFTEILAVKVSSWALEVRLGEPNAKT